MEVARLLRNASGHYAKQSYSDNSKKEAVAQFTAASANAKLEVSASKQRCSGNRSS